MLCWGLVQARRENMSQRNIKPVYYYSISVSPIIGTHRHNTPKEVQDIELNLCKSTLPNTMIPRYIPENIALVS